MARKPGRPPLDDEDESTPVHLSLPSRVYDELWERARKDRTTVQEVIRRDLNRRELRDC